MAARLPFIFSILLLLVLNIGVWVAAFPVDHQDNHTKPLYRRQCEWDEERQDYWDCDFELPTLAELVAHIRDTSKKGKGDAEHHAVFYTNLDDDNLAPLRDPKKAWFHGWLKKEELKYYWTADALNVRFLEVQRYIVQKYFDDFKAKYGPSVFKLLEYCYYHSLSAAAVNPEAYLFTKKDTPWLEASIWAAIEYPALTRNPNIQKIWRVDPRPPEVKGIKPEEACEHEKKELLWERGNDAEAAKRWECPVRLVESTSSSTSSSTSTPAASTPTS